MSTIPSSENRSAEQQRSHVGAPAQTSTPDLRQSDLVEAVDEETQEHAAKRTAVVIGPSPAVDHFLSLLARLVARRHLRNM